MGPDLAIFCTSCVCSGTQAEVSAGPAYSDARYATEAQSRRLTTCLLFCLEAVGVLREAAGEGMNHLPSGRSVEGAAAHAGAKNTTCVLAHSPP